jgi:multidrug efflux system outer membrane protein
MECILRSCTRGSGLLLMMLSLSACDLAPAYQPDRFIVPATWHGTSPFVDARPSDGELRQDWWKLYRDPILDELEEQAMEANPDLQAAAERFVQARDMMVEVHSQLIPHLGLGFGGSDDKESVHRLFRGPLNPIYDTSAYYGGIASWEPDFWSAIRNATRVELYRGEQRAADYALARLSLQAEIATDYFTLRGYDAQDSIYTQSIDYYKKSLAISEARLIGKIAPALDVARAKYLLYSTEAKKRDIQGNRQVAEHAIAILVNVAPSGFHIAPVNTLRMADFRIPAKVPSTLLERRPDIASMERKMAQANRTIGIAWAAFYPNVVFRADGGFEDNGFSLAKLANSFWSYGSSVSLPIFEGGLRRAQLQQSWSAFRETEDEYRSTVLNAFREVENGLSLTNRLTSETKQQDAAVSAAIKTQTLTMNLYKGGVTTSLDLIYTQISALTARITLVQVQIRSLQSSVALIRSLGGGWNRTQLATDDQIRPFKMCQYKDLTKPLPAAGIDVSAENRRVYSDLTKPVVH